MSEVLRKNIQVALVGSPNSGKTTLYNWLTGSKYKTVNYPGATVEYAIGDLQKALKEKTKTDVELHLEIMDTPGVYSLEPKSLDEEITVRILKDEKDLKCDAILVVVDATQLSRQLTFVQQIKESGVPFIVVLTMMDIFRKEKKQLDVQLLSREIGAPVIAFDGLLGEGLLDIVHVIQKTTFPLYQFKNVSWDPATQEKRQHESQKLAEKVGLQKSNSQYMQNTLMWDRYLLHPVFGYVFFIVIMTLLFSSIYWMATPFMDLIDSAAGVAISFTTDHIPGLVGDFLGNGLVAAAGGVIIFIPQIFILFIGLGLLENSGYLARVAALIDRPLSKVGLGGRSFVPMLSGFACAIPAIMATRNIPSRKEKLIAQNMIPLMSCSARLPVYGLMLGFLFQDGNPLMAGLIMALLYFLSLVVGAVASGIMARLIDSKERPRLMMDLPLYRKPRFRVLFFQAVEKSKSFLKRAGPIIFVLAIVLWFATNFPRPENIENLTTEQITEQSYAAQAGRFIEPVFKPMGVDWRVGFGIISAFAAREVFVSSLALVFNVAGEDEAQVDGLIKAMQQAQFPDGSPIFTVASVAGILIFFMIALQCLSTFGILKKESGSWKVAFAQLILSNFAAYVLAVSVVQTLKAFGF